MIEKGRHLNIERSLWLCQFCNSNVNVRKDEYHPLLVCPFYSDLRRIFFKKLLLFCSVKEGVLDHRSQVIWGFPSLFLVVWPNYMGFAFCLDSKFILNPIYSIWPTFGGQMSHPGILESVDLRVLGDFRQLCQWREIFMNYCDSVTCLF